MTSMLRREAIDPQPAIPDLITVPVAAGATVLIASDLHLRADPSSVTAHVEEGLVARLELRPPEAACVAFSGMPLPASAGLAPL